MKKKFLNLGLKYKITVVFLSIFFINILICNLTYYYFTSQSTVKNFQSFSIDMIRMVDMSLGERFKELQKTVNALSSNMSFVNPMKELLYNSNETNTPIIRGDIADVISEIEMSDDLISSMYIYTEGEIMDSYVLTRRPETRFEQTDICKYFKGYPNSTSAWFSTMVNPLYEEPGKVIPVVYRNKIANKDVFFIINISERALREYIENTMDYFDNVFIVDNKENNIINYGTYEEELLNNTKTKGNREQIICETVTIKGEDSLVAVSELGINGWLIYAVTSYSTLMGSIKQIELFLFFMAILTAAICTFLIIWSSNKLTGSLSHLAEQMEQVGGDHYETEFLYPYTDEVGKVARSYNYMLYQIRQHIKALENEKNHVREIQRQKRKYELVALQAQINPHFLYNTLNLITWQAVEQGADNISILSNALGKYFRISLSKGKEVISIANELEHVKNYLMIQKVRYKSKLNYIFFVPETIQNNSIIKLVLQPLVENAIYHGFSNKDGEGTIIISGRENKNQIILTVEDDGQGMEETEQNHINEMLQHGEMSDKNGYGIFNVNKRIRLFYGEEYGLIFEQGARSGTRAIITIPKVQMEEERNV